MTETQAKSGAAGASTNPVEQDAAEGGTPATGRAAVGRATVPAESGSPKFTRAPGMVPPPDEPPAERPDNYDGAGDGGGDRRAKAGRVATATPPMVISAPSIAPGSAPPGRTAAPGRPSPAGPGVRGTTAVGAARVTEAVRAARSSVSAAAARGPRRARLNVKRIDPWSVMKFSFAVSLVLFIVVIVATSVLYLALDAMGVFDTVNQTLADMLSATGGETASTFKITAKGVIGTSALIGAVNVVLFTALATLAAFIYNVCADLVGGIEVTLSERR
jgi:Transmembrane domain of unknown function (DUF3566)